MAKLQTPEAREKNEVAKLLYYQGYNITEIAEILQWPYGTLYAWKERQGWDHVSSVQRVKTAIDARMVQLVLKQQKTKMDLCEIERLTHSLERCVRMEKFEQPDGKIGDINPNMKDRHKRVKNKKLKNDITPEDIAKLKESFHDELFQYQKNWWDVKEGMREKTIAARVRNILKSRQIGATYYFAKEAALDAFTTGDNQIFLSASRSQAHIFKSYIYKWVRDVCDKELTGENYTLANGAELMFLGTNYRTAQGYHGHFYMDEYFWIYGFNELRKVASGVAAQKQWRQTYFSTPSSINHEAYPFWTGERINKGRKGSDRIQVDVSQQALAGGALCDDKQWRQILTIEGAEDQGCNLFDLDEIRMEYSEEEFRNLFLCEFVNDTDSVFSLAELQHCLVDSWEVWDDVRPLTTRPFGNRPVWLGYDPSRSKDDASLSIVAPPAVDGGKFRVLDKVSFNGLDFTDQAARIKKFCDIYNVEFIGIDVTGMGVGVYDLVKKFRPDARQILYTVESKNQLVLKAKHLIRHRRLEFDAGWKEVVMAFLTIRRSITPSGKQISFNSSRTDETGHADVAWSIMHALDKLQLNDIEGGTGNSRNVLEIS